MKTAPALRRLAGASSLIAFAVACNAISGLDVDYKVKETSGTEGPDTGADAAKTDAGSSGGFDAEPGRCPTPNIFCEDFEAVSSSTSPYGWSRDEQLGGTPQIGADGYQSAHSLLAISGAAGCPGGTRPSCAVAIWKAVEGGFPDRATLTVTFRFRVVSAENEYAVIAAIQANGKEYGLAVYRNGECPANGACLDENDLNGSHTFEGAVAYAKNEWLQGRVEVTRSGSSFAGEVFVGDKQLDVRTTGALPEGLPDDVDVGVGAFFTGRSGVVEANVDDVVVTRTP